MEVSLGGRILQYPATPDELRLDTWAAFVRDYPPTEKRPDHGPFTTYITTADRAYELAAYFAQISEDEAREIFPFLPTLDLCRKFFTEVFIKSPGPWITADCLEYDLPVPQLQPNDGVTFGEFIDSKMIVQAGMAEHLNQWEILQQLSAIWLRRSGEAYEESFLHAGSERLVIMGGLPIGQAIRVQAFWEAFNDDCAKRFSIFKPSAIKGGRFSAKHFEQWGWVNFLKGIAKTKVFDIPGWNLNSIECARRASAYDVLVFASEEKDYGEAHYMDQQALFHK